MIQKHSTPVLRNRTAGTLAHRRGLTRNTALRTEPMEHRTLLSAVSPAETSATVEDTAAEMNQRDFGSWVFAASDLGSERNAEDSAETSTRPDGPASQRIGVEPGLNSDSSMLENSTADVPESTVERDAPQSVTQGNSADAAAPAYTWPAISISGFRAESTVSAVTILQMLAARNSAAQNPGFAQILNSKGHNHQLPENLSHRILTDATDAEFGSSDDPAISSGSQQSEVTAEFSRVIDSGESLSGKFRASPEPQDSIEHGLEELWPEILSHKTPERNSQHLAPPQAKKKVQRVQHVEVQSPVEDQHIAKKIEFAGGVSRPSPVVIRAGATRHAGGESQADTETSGDEDSVPILASECLKSEWWASNRESTAPEIRPIQAEIR